MSVYGVSVFTLAYLLAVATPGPGVAAVIARSLGHGLRGAPAFIGGFLVGDLVWFTLAATGLAMLAQSAYTLFLGVKYAGALYLLYLAWKLWRSPATPYEAGAPAAPERSLQLFLGSLALTLGNPKTMIFFLAVLPTVVELRQLTATGYFEIVSVIVVILPLVLGGYAFGAARARRCFASPKTVQWMRRSTGIAMAGAAVAVATR